MADLHAHTGQYSEDELANMRARMRGFILPNVVRTEEEKAAFESACMYQIEHEKRRQDVLKDKSIPDGVTSVQIGHFAMQFDVDAFKTTLNRRTICDAAYAELLYAGLLYRGLEGRCGTCL